MCSQACAQPHACVGVSRMLVYSTTCPHTHKNTRAPCKMYGSKLLFSLFSVLKPCQPSAHLDTNPLPNFSNAAASEEGKDPALNPCTPLSRSKPNIHSPISPDVSPPTASFPSGEVPAPECSLTTASPSRFLPSNMPPAPTPATIFISSTDQLIPVPCFSSDRDRPVVWTGARYVCV